MLGIDEIGIDAEEHFSLLLLESCDGESGHKEHVGVSHTPSGGQGLAPYFLTVS
jgi:hypothetical protein